MHSVGSRRSRFSWATLTALALLWLPLPGASFADDTPAVLSAHAAQIPALDPEIVVVHGGKNISALPIRLRIEDQASPLAYSLDLERSPEYSSKWTAISPGSADNALDQTQSQVGVPKLLVAELIARGGASDVEQVAAATTPQEYAARQIAIWAYTNALSLDASTVPNADLLSRAKDLYKLGESNKNVPLQAAKHAVSIFIRETTANSVRLAIILTLDPNTTTSTAQNIDLYLDGVLCKVQTQALTRIRHSDNGVYKSDEPIPVSDGDGGSTGIAEVELDRNDKVVDASANWVNVRSDPGLLLGSDGASPPVITADPAILNYETDLRLNPTDYSGPQQLLDKAGANVLASTPGWAVWLVLLIGLYLISRTGRWVDVGLKWLWRRVRGIDDFGDRGADIRVVAMSREAAVELGMAGLKVTSQHSIQIVELDAPKKGLLGRRPGKYLFRSHLVRKDSGSSD